MPDAVRVDRAGPVATVILERPAVRNAVDPATAAALAAAFASLDDDPAIHSIVLWGAGGTFCAGADLQAVAQGWDPARLQALDENGEDIGDRLFDYGKDEIKLRRPLMPAMLTRDAIKIELATAELVAMAYLDDLSDAELMQRPHPQCNHLNWQIGHLVASEHAMMKGFVPGGMPPLPEGRSTPSLRSPRSKTPTIG